VTHKPSDAVPDTALDADVAVIGCGVAGLGAAVSIAEEAGDGVRVCVLERSSKEERGGNSRWSGAHLRLADEYTLAPDFVEDMVRFSRGLSDRAYIERLAERVPETMDWLGSLGARFRRLPRTTFLTKARPRVVPVGGCVSLVDILARRAEELGVRFEYETAAVKLLVDDAGRVSGVRVRQGGQLRDLRARIVVIASGGFEGNPEMITQYLGPGAGMLEPVSPGGRNNKGEGIRMALEIGARPSGEWGSFHASPTDQRSSQPEPSIMVFPHGILVNRLGERFVDEGADTADEQNDIVARAIWRQPDQIAYAIFDHKLLSVPYYQDGIWSDRRPVEAESLTALAEALGIDSEGLCSTVAAFNADITSTPFDGTRLDGKKTRSIRPPKSNWAQAIDEPPFLAYPMMCRIVFTYGGIATTADAAVLSNDGDVIDGLLAAGECTGLYYHKYPGATSVLRSLVYGRIAGQTAARALAGGAVAMQS